MLLTSSWKTFILICWVILKGIFAHHNIVTFSDDIDMSCIFLSEDFKIDDNFCLSRTVFLQS